ncbi:bile acid:sodium symporter family protein [Endozoicomonas atrinae]|uniref:bile acid:sodium symporter family protein n=1 Tax=Endozoicomonas atrinae TaxID=1333660 RepID=UPI003B00ED7A
MRDYFSLLLPLWALLASILGYFFSPELTPFKNTLIPIIALIMFVMGLTITTQDLKTTFRKPQPLMIGVLLQFLLMPASAWLISTILGLPQEILIGMILVGSAPGGDLFQCPYLPCWGASGSIGQYDNGIYPGFNHPNPLDYCSLFTGGYPR